MKAPKKFMDDWKLNKMCPACQGKGSDPHNQTVACETCQGMRVIPREEGNHENNV